MPIYRFDSDMVRRGFVIFEPPDLFRVSGSPERIFKLIAERQTQRRWHKHAHRLHTWFVVEVRDDLPYRGLP
jgi:hypothetical protein